MIGMTAVFSSLKKKFKKKRKKDNTGKISLKFEVMANIEFHAKG